MDESWRNRFSEYTTSAAFRLTLSKPQYKALAQLVEMEEREKGGGWILFCAHSNLGTLTALERKGLIHHDGDTYRATEAGRKVLELVFMVFPEETLRAKGPVMVMEKVDGLPDGCQAGK